MGSKPYYDGSREIEQFVLGFKTCNFQNIKTYKISKKEELDWKNMIIIVSFVRKHLKDNYAYPYHINDRERFINALNQEIIKILDKAIQRAKLNNRKTVKPFDL